MIASTIAEAGIGIWQRALQKRKKLSPEVAEALIGLRISKRDLDRADALAQKRCSGRAMTDAEESELEAFRMVGTTLELLQSKARKSLGIRVRV
jgi:hypothetical protein